jgi:hypothetical protein
MSSGDPAIQVEVTNPNMHKTYFFPCNDWLKKVRPARHGRVVLHSRSRLGLCS